MDRSKPIEANTILTTLDDDAESRATLSKFLDRWNNTASAWENGTLNELTDTSDVISLTRMEPRIVQYIADVDGAEDRGYASVFEEYDVAVNTYVTAKQESQVIIVCAAG